MKKGMAYSGILVAILYALYIVLNAKLSQGVMSALPIPVGILAGAFLFPFLKTIIETFKKKINELTVLDKGSAEIRDYIKLRQTRPFVVKEQGLSAA